MGYIRSLIAVFSLIAADQFITSPALFNLISFMSVLLVVTAILDNAEHVKRYKEYSDATIQRLLKLH